MSNTALLALNALLVLLLVATQREWFSRHLAALWASLDGWVDSRTVLIAYGIVLLYLIVVVHLPPEPRAARTQYRLMPVRGQNGEVQKLALRRVGRVNDREVGQGAVHAVTPTLQSSLPPHSSHLQYWDGFPNGTFHYEFTRQEVEDTFQLAVYWACNRLPGRPGSSDARTLQRGSISRFKCLGAIQCVSSRCTITIAPAGDISKQLAMSCLCGSALEHTTCDVQWSVNIYSAGALWENDGSHLHPAYTHSLPVGTHDTLGIQPLIRRAPVTLHGSSQPFSAELAQMNHGMGFNRPGDERSRSVLAAARTRSSFSVPHAAANAPQPADSQLSTKDQPTQTAIQRRGSRHSSVAMQARSAEEVVSRKQLQKHSEQQVTEMRDGFGDSGDEMLEDPTANDSDEKEL
ncbi:hypothetical protein C8F01DRAFT_1187586 [Mycena amicta]|nr:hypothetical protein C8F01DRAFT_1187586 [Mycena amicta]